MVSYCEEGLNFMGVCMCTYYLIYALEEKMYYCEGGFKSMIYVSIHFYRKKWFATMKKTFELMNVCIHNLYMHYRIEMVSYCEEGIDFMGVCIYTYLYRCMYIYLSYICIIV